MNHDKNFNKTMQSYYKSLLFSSGFGFFQIGVTCFMAIIYVLK